MTLQTLQRPYIWPGNAYTAPGSAMQTGSILDAAGEYYAVVIRASEPMTISHVGFLASSVAGSPTADVRIETVDPATGLPTGTLWAANTNIVTATLSNGWALHALTASASLAAGDVVAVKIAFNSGTSFRNNILNSNNYGSSSGLPYSVINSGTPTKTILGNHMVAIGSSATAFFSMDGLYPVSAIASNVFNNTNAAKRGARFKFPFKARARGLRIFLNGAVGNFNAMLLSDAGADFASTSRLYDGDIAAVAPVNAVFAAPATLLPDVWYRAVIEPTSSTDANVTTLSAPSADYMAAMPGATDFYYTTLASGVWTDDNAKVPILDLLLDQLDNGVQPHVIGG